MRRTPSGDGHPRRSSSGPRGKRRNSTSRNKLGLVAVVAVLFIVIIAVVSLGSGGSQGDSQAVVGEAENQAQGQTQAGTAEAGATHQQEANTTDASTLPRRTDPFSVSFASTGDIIFAREVGTYVDMYGGASAMENVAEELAAADVTIANIEAPLTDNLDNPIEEKDVYLVSRPAGIESLKNSDITFASLANNHSMDYSGPGLQDTMTLLDNAGIKHAGAGMNEKEAEQYAETTVGDVSIAFLSWSDIIPPNFLASGDEPGIVTRRLDEEGAKKKVYEAKKTHDIVVVAMHWGVEYEDYINDIQREAGHQLVDAGADVIIGNHPHVIEGIEFYNGSLISYSQGDFVFDHYSQKTGESFILKFNVTQNGIEGVEVTPVYLDDTYGIPSIVTGDHAQEIIARLQEISDGMNSNFEVVGDKAYITPAA